MRKGTDKKRGAAICAGVMIALMVFYFAALIFAVISEKSAFLALIGISVVYGAIFLAVIAGIIVALRQRFREIDSGEEEDAKKY